VNNVRLQHRELVVSPVSGAAGARVEGVDLRRIDGDTMARLRQAFLDHCVLVFPGQQHLTTEAFVAFSSHWGEVERVRNLKGCVDDNPAVLLLDFKGAKPPTDQWHSDLTLQECPPLGSLLLARVVPVGGDTIFANQYLAYEALSDGLKKALNGLNAVHGGPGLSEAFARGMGVDPASLPTNTHPVVRTHPETGRKALYVNRAYTKNFEGMTAEESWPLLDWLYDHAVQPNFTFRHHWTVGDLVMWDNRCLQHFAVADYGSLPRTMHRVTILGDRPR
jgi:taurine dioxygenase